MILDIVKCGHPVLREQGRRIERVTPALRQLTANMIETMYAANGVGLAAPQIGQALLLAVIDVASAEEPGELRIDGKAQTIQSRMPLVILNPVVTRSEGEQTGSEGCLSVPDISADIRRAARVWVAASNLELNRFEIEATGLLARALQHEVDHLNGILFMDRMDSATRVSLEGRIKKLQKETQTELKKTGRRRPEPAGLL